MTIMLLLCGATLASTGGAVTGGIVNHLLASRKVFAGTVKPARSAWRSETVAIARIGLSCLSPDEIANWLPTLADAPSGRTLWLSSWPYGGCVVDATSFVDTDQDDPVGNPAVWQASIPEGEVDRTASLFIHLR